MKKLMFFLVVLTLFCNCVFSTIPEPEGCWSLDTDDLYDSSPNGMKGIDSGTSSITGIIGNARDFETDDNDYIHVNDSVANSPTGVLTMSMWLKVESAIGGANGGGVGKGVDGGTPAWWFMTQTGGTLTPWAIAYDGAGAQKGYPTSSEALIPGSWYHVVFTIDAVNGEMRIYINGTQRAETTGISFNSNIIRDTTSSLTFGYSGVGSDPYFDGIIDEVKLWKAELTPDQIVEDFNTGLGVSCGTLFPQGASINSVNLTNRTNNFLSSALLTEMHEFFIKANVTLNDVQDSGINCSWNTGNIISIFDNYPSGNITRFNNTPLFNGTIVNDESITDVFKEDITFKLCWIGSIKYDVDFFINDAFYYTIDKNSIPLCTSGYFEYRNVTTITPTTQVNVSLVCSDCNGVNGVRLLSIDGRSETWERFYSKHGHNMTFNSSNNLYEFKEVLHRFSTGSNQLNVTCNTTLSTNNFIVGDLAPTSSLIDICTDECISFVNASILENANTTIVGSCSNEIISFKQLNVSFDNGTLIKTVNNTFVQIDVDSLSSDGLYYAILYCRDDDGNTSTTKKYFWSNDTVNPNINIISPNGSVTIGDNATLQIQVTDNNLYGVNITVECNIQGEVFSYVNTNLTTNNFFFNNLTQALSVVQSCNVIIEACDDHTDNVFSVDSVSSSFDKKSIFVDDVLAFKDSSIYGVKQVDFIQKTDRLSWCISYDTFEDKFVKDKIYTFKIPKNESWTFRGLTIGHFASWNTKKWIDFNPDIGFDVRLDSITEDSEFFIIKVKSDNDKICVDSIGGLNCETEIYPFSVIAEIVESESTTIESISIGYSLFLTLLAVCWMVLLIACAITRNLILGLISCLFGFFFGIFIISLSQAFGVANIVISAMLFLGLMLTGKIK